MIPGAVATRDTRNRSREDFHMWTRCDARASRLSDSESAPRSRSPAMQLRSFGPVGLNQLVEGFNQLVSVCRRGGVTDIYIYISYISEPKSASFVFGGRVVPPLW
jgi:hypothetical protein